MLITIETKKTSQYIVLKFTISSDKETSPDYGFSSSFGTGETGEYLAIEHAMKQIKAVLKKK